MADEWRATFAAAMAELRGMNDEIESMRAKLAKSNRMLTHAEVLQAELDTLRDYMAQHAPLQLRSFDIRDARPENMEKWAATPSPEE